MKKRLVAAILCLVTLVGVLAGCNNAYVATDTSTRAMTVVIALVSDDKPSEDARLEVEKALSTVTKQLYSIEVRLDIYTPDEYRSAITKKLEAREEALALLLPYQRDDFYKLYMAMEGKNVNVRLLDPPLHEFLPHTEEDIKEVAAIMGVPEEKVAAKVVELHEQNPMLGHRGCRLAITGPEIAIMQTEAIIGAAIEVCKEDGLEIVLTIVSIISLEFSFLISLASIYFSDSFIRLPIKVLKLLALSLSNRLIFG